VQGGARAYRLSITPASQKAVSLVARLDIISSEPASEARTEGARDRLLVAASALFCRQGINSTGVDAIVERAGTAKATLYKLFGSKERLVEAVLEREGLLWRRWFCERLASLDLPAREKLEAAFDVLGEWFARDDYAGCPFINAVGEHDKTDARVRMLALRHKAQIDDFLVGLAREAGAADAEALVSDMGLLIDGAIVVAMIARRPEVAHQAKGAFRAMAAAHWAK
jgi:AcrR family transcriptional regulator